MADRDPLQHINDLVEEEHRLRSSGEGADTERLAAIERELDQCWDLLRQRRARKEFGEDESQAEPRSQRVVEGYQQ